MLLPGRGAAVCNVAAGACGTAVGSSAAELLCINTEGLCRMCIAATVVVGWGLGVAGMEPQFGLSSAALRLGTIYWVGRGLCLSGYCQHMFGQTSTAAQLLGSIESV